jgi:hypothetical protein
MINTMDASYTLPDEHIKAIRRYKEAITHSSHGQVVIEDMMISQENKNRKELHYGHQV